MQSFSSACPLFQHHLSWLAVEGAWKSENRYGSAPEFRKLWLPLSCLCHCFFAHDSARTANFAWFLPFSAASSQTIWCNIWFSICTRNCRTDESWQPPRHAINIHRYICFYLTRFAYIYLRLQTVCHAWNIFCLRKVIAWIIEQVNKSESYYLNMRRAQKNYKKAIQPAKRVKCQICKYKLMEYFLSASFWMPGRR